MFGLSGLSGYLSIAVVVLTIAGYVLFNSLISAKAQITTLEATNKAYVVQMEANKAIQKSFEASHNTLVLLYQEKDAQYKKDASREHIVLAKKALVEKLANRKFKSQEKEAACLTGNTSKC